MLASIMLFGAVPGVLAQAGSNGNKAELAMPCNSCNASEAAATAISATGKSTLTRSVTVFDFGNREMRRFLVKVDKGSPGSVRKSAEPFPVPPEDLEVFDA